MPSGGKRPGAGRPKGSGLAKRSSAAAKREIDSGKALPLEIMLEAMRLHAEKNDWDKAAAIAKDAAPYVHSRLAAISHTGANGGPISFVDLKELTDEQLAALEPVLKALAEFDGAEHRTDS